MGEDHVALGDWNRTVDEDPMATFIANGMVSYGDEPWQCGLQPSRPTGRHVHFAIHSNNTRIDDREVEGIADHSCILYDTPVTDRDRGSRWPEVKNS